jgi:hypothetical protein
MLEDTKLSTVLDPNMLLEIEGNKLLHGNA